MQGTKFIIRMDVMDIYLKQATLENGTSCLNEIYLYE